MSEVLEKTETLTDTAEINIPSVAKPFSINGNSIMINDRAIMKHIGNVTLVNSVIRATLNAKQHEIFDDIMFDLRTLGRPIIRLDSFSEYFDGRKQFDKIIANPAMAPVLAESIGLQFSTEDMAIINGFTSLREKVTTFFKGLGPSYDLAPKPSHNASELVYNEKLGQISNSAGYKVSKKQFENVWKRCYKLWANGEQDNNTGTITESNGYGRRHTISVKNDKVDIGCQTSSRWQVEQMALKLGLLEV